MSDSVKTTEEVVWISVPVDPVTAARLQALSDMCHASPVTIAGSLLHDVLAEDDAHHEPAQRAFSVN